jgi:hypothetical protein
MSYSMGMKNMEVVVNLNEVISVIILYKKNTEQYGSSDIGYDFYSTCTWFKSRLGHLLY